MDPVEMGTPRARLLISGGSRGWPVPHTVVVESQGTGWLCEEEEAKQGQCGSKLVPTWVL